MNPDLPDYKQEFLGELEEYRRSQQNYEDDQNYTQTQQELKANKVLPFKVTNTNEIWNTTKYAQPEWRGNLQTSYYNKEHNKNQYDLNLVLNPEVAKKTNNMRATQISEYSNAKHNNTVFINPKFTSC